jgi:REP element-mobilizing transposase RayT
MLDVRPLREAFEKRRMVLAAATLDTLERDVVLRAIRNVCDHEKWTLYGVHVRATHVHVIVAAKPSPETVMGKLKAYASRALNKRFGHRSKRWTRHGSTKRVWSPVALEATLSYVLDRQGERMACYENPDRWPHVR